MILTVWSTRRLARLRDDIVCLVVPIPLVNLPLRLRRVCIMRTDAFRFLRCTSISTPQMSPFLDGAVRMKELIEEGAEPWGCRRWRSPDARESSRRDPNFTKGGNRRRDQTDHRLRSLHGSRGDERSGHEPAATPPTISPSWQKDETGYDIATSAVKMISIAHLDGFSLQAADRQGDCSRSIPPG